MAERHSICASRSAQAEFPRGAGVSVPRGQSVVSFHAPLRMAARQGTFKEMMMSEIKVKVAVGHGFAFYQRFSTLCV